MNINKIKNLLAELDTELSTAPGIDETTKSLLEELKSRLETADIANEPSIADTALLLETHFAAEHPVAEKLMRELINTLSKMGV